MTRYRSGICAVAAALAFAGAAGCGEDEAGDQTVSAPSSTATDVATPEDETSTSADETSTDEEGASEAPETSGSGDAVEIVEFIFEPEELIVPVGTTVTFTNQDTAAHTATADDSSFDTEELGKGDSAEETFDEPGTFTYYCRFHVFMKGSVVVE